MKTQQRHAIVKIIETSQDFSSLPLPENPKILPEKKEFSSQNKKKNVQFGPLIDQAALKHQIDPALVRAIIMAESSYNPKAISKKGASGLMQLMPKTAAALGVEDVFNPEDNINAGVGYFRTLMNQFDDNVELALAAYNAGSRNVRKYQGIPPYKATKYYIKKVFEYYHSYKKPNTEEAGVKKPNLTYF